MHFMYLLEGLLPSEDGNSVNNCQNAEHSQTGAQHVSSEEAVQGPLLRAESSDDNTTEHDYTRSQHHAWTADIAVVTAVLADGLPEEMAWDLLPAAERAMHQVMHGVLHRLLHQPPPSVRCLHPA